MPNTVAEEITDLEHQAKTLRSELRFVTRELNRLNCLLDKYEHKNKELKGKLSFARGFIHSCFVRNLFLNKVPQHVSEDILAVLDC